MSHTYEERSKITADIVSRYLRKKSALIPLLHLAQEQDGYMTKEAMVHIAQVLDLTPAEVYGTASFYEMFKFHPVGVWCIDICTNISCRLTGAWDLLNHAQEYPGIATGGTTDDGLFALEDVECIGAYTEAPALQVNYRYRYKVTSDTFDDLVAGLKSGKLTDEFPPHGTLSSIRQEPTPAWCGKGTLAQAQADAR